MTDPEMTMQQKSLLFCLNHHQLSGPYGTLTFVQSRIIFYVILAFETTKVNLMTGKIMTNKKRHFYVKKAVGIKKPLTRFFKYDLV